MNQSNVSEFPAEPRSMAPPLLSATRPLYWSIRREIWENRSIYLGPLIVAGIALFGFLVSIARTLNNLRRVPSLEPSRQLNVVVTPYSIVASMILLSGFIIGAFYAIDALNSERRDRSLLFWKSMPVSDLMTVLSKAAIPIVVLPALTAAIALTVQAIMLALSSMLLAGNGISPSTLWSRWPGVHMTGVMIYGVAVHALWFAPIYCWFILVSAWARRAAILWALLPFFAMYAIEKIAFGTSLFASLVKYRLGGAMVEAFRNLDMNQAVTRFHQLSPINFLTSPGLWFGLIFGGACLAAASRLRRSRGPS